MGEHPDWGPESWQLGGRIDEYRLLEKLGQGGMGTVYLAESLRTGVRYAIKTMSPRHPPVVQARFRREGRLQAAVDQHPNVVRVRRSGRASDPVRKG